VLFGAYNKDVRDIIWLWCELK